MAEKSVLQRALILGLVEIGDNDKGFDDLARAAEQISWALCESPPKLIPAALAAVDASTPENDPHIVSVRDAVVSNWPTFPNQFPAGDLEVLRAVSLQAVASATERSDDFGTIVALALHPTHHLRDAGRHGKLVRSFVDSLLDAAERSISDPWTSAPSVEFPELSAGRPSLTLGVQTSIYAAIGPNDAKGQPIEGANPHTPNEGQLWATEFAKRIPKAMLDTANLSNTHMRTAIAGISVALRDYVAVLQASGARVEALWWAESLYSSSLERSYRTMSPALAIVAMAGDLASLIPIPAPASVPYFLAETVHRVLGDKNRKLSLRAISEQLDEHYSELARCTSQLSLAGRSSLAGAVSRAANGETPVADAIAASSGVPLTAEMSLSDMAKILFSDLQAHRLAANTAPIRPQSDAAEGGE